MTQQKDTKRREMKPLTQPARNMPSSAKLPAEPSNSKPSAGVPFAPPEEFGPPGGDSSQLIALVTPCGTYKRCRQLVATCSNHMQPQHWCHILSYHIAAMWWLAKVETHWNLILVWLLHVVSNTIIYDHIRSTKISFRPGSPSAQAKQASAAAPGQRPWAKLSLLSPGTCSVFVAPSLSTVLDSRGESLVHVFKNDAGHRGFGPTKTFRITMGVWLDPLLWGTSMCTATRCIDADTWTK